LACHGVHQRYRGDLHRQDLPVHTVVGCAFAGAWSAALWFKYRTKITILWIPSFYLWPVIGVLSALR
jgi:hypothetical protein